MEVHAHSHTPRKKWTHYLWEFFMLFLAITLGFMVENRREHYIEHNRAKVYAKGMIKNLAEDTMELSQIIHNGELAAVFLDSFLTLISDHDFDKIPTGKLYFYGLWGGYMRGFESNDATFQQMKSSGSLRYFDNPVLEQLIGEYDQLIRSMHSLDEIDRPIFLETRKARARIFAYKYNNEASKIVQSSVFTDFNSDVIDSFIKTNPPLLTGDIIIFNEYAELCRSRNLKQQLTNNKRALSIATAIIKRIKKDYHLK